MAIWCRSEVSGLSWGNPGQGQFAVAENGSQNVVEVVGNATGQRADGLHLMGLPELFLQLFLGSDIADTFNPGDNIASRVFHRAGGDLQMDDSILTRGSGLAAMDFAVGKGLNKEAAVTYC